MIELNSVMVILMIEALVGLGLLVLGFFMFSKNKSSGEEKVANELIDKLEDTKNIKAKKLKKLISEYCTLDPDTQKKVLDEISQSERILYQQIIQMFLKRDIEILVDLDQHINNVSEPYIKMVTNASDKAKETETQDVAKNKMSKLMEENKRLSEQLNMSMKTMDEISAEYTRVFSGTQTELELANSSKKMFKVFQYAEKRVRASFKDTEVKEL